MLEPPYIEPRVQGLSCLFSLATAICIASCIAAGLETRVEADSSYLKEIKLFKNSKEEKEAF